MNSWTTLREALLLIEAAEYRGQSGVRFVDLISLVGAIIDPDHTMERTERERKARALLKPGGGAMDCSYDFNRKVWGDWVPNANSALAKAGTDSARKSSQYPGEPRGGTVMKRNYGGRVVYQPGRRDQAHEQQPSAMDTYDLLMRADGDTLTRFAYAPSQGRFEERAARLEDLMAGRGALPLKRRPQPEKPEPPPDAPANPKAQPVPRVGQNTQLGDEDDDRRAGAMQARERNPVPFRDRIAKLSRDAGERKPPPAEDEEEPLFPPKRGK